MSADKAQATADQLVETVAERSRAMAMVRMAQAGAPPLTESELLTFDLGVGIAVLQTMLILQDAGLMPS